MFELRSDLQAQLEAIAQARGVTVEIALEELVGLYRGTTNVFLWDGTCLYHPRSRLAKARAVRAQMRQREPVFLPGAKTAASTDITPTIVNMAQEHVANFRGGAISQPPAILTYEDLAESELAEERALGAAYDEMHAQTASVHAEIDSIKAESQELQRSTASAIDRLLELTSGMDREAA